MAAGSYAELHTDGHVCTTNPLKCSNGWSLAAWFKGWDPYVSVHWSFVSEMMKFIFSCVFFN